MSQLNKSLPIISIFREALSFPRKHYRLLLKVGTPLIITGVLFTLLTYFSTNTESSPVYIALSALWAIAFIPSLVIAIVGCHRIFLLDDSVNEEISLFNWTGNEIVYIGWWIVIGICAVLVTIPIFLVLMPFVIASVGGVFDGPIVLIVIASLMNIPVYYVASRWMLVLPSSAIGLHGKTLSWSWGLSSGNGWRLTLLVGFLPFITDLIFELLPSYESILYSLLQGALWLVIGVVEVGLLSLSYKFLVSQENVDHTGERESDEAGRSGSE